MNNILVTGGAGFIGSHTCINLLEQGYELTVIDSNVNSSSLSLVRIKEILKKKKVDFNYKLTFKKGDIRDQFFMNLLFLEAKEKGKPIEGVIHLAGLKSVEESIKKPLVYWENNVFGTMNLLKIMKKFDCKTIVFSSSATIYGVVSSDPIDEKCIINPNNPYGQTKASIEFMLKGIFESSKDKWRIANLRYFNPIGAHESGLIGENPSDVPNNLFPIICNVAQGKFGELKIFGNDWPTLDGTGVRDYIHVMDLAEAHTRALDFLFSNKAQLIDLNIGTGIGTSVLELIEKFSKVNNCSVPFSYSERRQGDAPVVIANNNKAISVLNWKPKRNLEEMCKDGWEWIKNNPLGYQ
jgi:UDP-glucose 4-epimerase